MKDRCQVTEKDQRQSVSVPREANVDGDGVMCPHTVFD